VAPSLLYPRLPPAVAQHLFEDLKSQSVVTMPHATSHPDAVFAALGGVEASKDMLGSLADAIRHEARTAGFPRPPEDGSAGAARFDLACADVLRKRMDMVPAEAASVDVWAFIGAILLPDVSFWRFPEPPADRVIGPDLTRHTFARLWWRAYMLADLDGQEGLSVLSAISESEMNQLFERRSIGGNRKLVRATARQLLKLDKDRRRREPVRDAIRRIRRLLAFLIPESLADSDLDEVIAQVFAEAPAGPAAPSVPDQGSPRPEVVTPPTPPEPSPPSVEFDDVHLAEVPAQIAKVVIEKGGVAGSDLPAVYEAKYHIKVSAARVELLNRLAWSAGGRQFIRRDEINDLWLPGSVSPIPIAQLGDWTIARIRRRALDLLRANPKQDPWEQLVGEVYQSGGGRTPKVVLGIVGKLVAEVKREMRQR
jgi:Family of unknown function (DUF6339)